GGCSSTTTKRKRATKHGGGRQRKDLDADLIAMPEPDEDVIALSEALDQLATKEPLKAELVKLRYFAGLTAGLFGSHPNNRHIGRRSMQFRSSDANSRPFE